MLEAGIQHQYLQEILNIISVRHCQTGTLKWKSSHPPTLSELLNISTFNFLLLLLPFCCVICCAVIYTPGAPSASHGGRTGQETAAPHSASWQEGQRNTRLQ